MSRSDQRARLARLSLRVGGAAGRSGDPAHTGCQTTSIDRSTTVTLPHVSEALTAHSQRIGRLREQLARQELDAFLVTNPENRRYLSGFTGHDSGADSAGALIVSRDAISLITDGRYTELAARECPGLRVIHRQGPFAPLAAETLLATGAQRIGF